MTKSICSKIYLSVPKASELIRLKKLSIEVLSEQYKISALDDEPEISFHYKFTTTFKNVTGVLLSELIKSLFKFKIKTLKALKVITLAYMKKFT